MEVGMENGMEWKSGSSCRWMQGRCTGSQNWKGTVDVCAVVLEVAVPDAGKQVCEIAKGVKALCTLMVCDHDGVPLLMCAPVGMDDNPLNLGAWGYECMDVRYLRAGRCMSPPGQEPASAAVRPPSDMMRCHAQCLIHVVIASSMHASLWAPHAPLCSSDTAALLMVWEWVGGYSGHLKRLRLLLMASTRA